MKHSFAFLILFLFVPSFATSQIEDCYLWANPDQDGIILRWTFCIDSVLPSNSYSVLRREKNQSDFREVGNTNAIQAAKWKEYSNISANTLDTINRMVEICSDSRRPGDIRKKAYKSLQKLHLLRPELYSRLFGLSFTDTTALSNKTYDYKIEYNGKELSTLENISLRYLEAKTVRSFQVFPLRNAIRLQWKLFNDFPRGILGYIVYKKSPNTIDFIRQPQVHYVYSVTNSELFDFSIEDRNVIAGNRYTYAVTPIDVFGREGLRSDTMSVVPRSEDEEKIPNNISISFIGDSVLLTWEKPLIASFSGYHIYRYPSENKEEKIRITKNVLSADTKSFVDKPMGILTDYLSYVITTISQNGVESSSAAEQTVLFPDNIDPDMPSFITTYGIRRGIVLSWQRSKSKDVVGYELFRSENEEGDFYPVELDMVKDTFYVDIIPSNQENTTFWYQVRAVDKNGNKSSLTLVTPGYVVSKNAPKPVVLNDAYIRDNKVVLHWNASSKDVNRGFWVNRYNDTTYSPITINSAYIIGNDYIDSSLLKKQQYWYEIISVDSNYNYSLPSNKIAVDLRYSTASNSTLIDTVIVELDSVRIFFTNETINADIEFLVELSKNKSEFEALSVVKPQGTKFYTFPINQKNQVLVLRIRKRDSFSPWQKPEDSYTITILNGSTE